MLQKSNSWQLFNKIASKYDLVNTILSFGLHKSWKRKFIQTLPSTSGIELLDLATGTSDIMLAYASKNKAYKHMLGIDPAKEMLAIGKQKLYAAQVKRFDLQLGDAQNLKLKNESVDVITISFGIRNVADIDKAFAEMYRALKPGGSLHILEFSQPTHFFIKPFHLLYLRTVVPFVGGLLTGNFKGYDYLDKTIESFLYGPAMCQKLEKIGFEKAEYTPLTFGTVGIYQAKKTPC